MHSSVKPFLGLKSQKLKAGHQKQSSVCQVQPKKPLWDSATCLSLLFDWQGLPLGCQAFPRTGNCWRQSAEATSHPWWTAARQRAGDGENTDLQERAHTDRQHAHFIQEELAHKGGSVLVYGILVFVKACFCECLQSTMFAQRLISISQFSICGSHSLVFGFWYCVMFWVRGSKINEMSL